MQQKLIAKFLSPLCNANNKFNICNQMRYAGFAMVGRVFCSRTGSKRVNLCYAGDWHLCTVPPTATGLQLHGFLMPVNKLSVNIRRQEKKGDSQLVRLSHPILPCVYTKQNIKLYHATIVLLANFMVGI